jgi:hypothetical protein
LTLRAYLRGKSWDEQYVVGLKALRQAGVEVKNTTLSQLDTDELGRPLRCSDEGIFRPD